MTAAVGPVVAPVVASVPGKLILVGEHAAVYGSPALVAAVGLRVRVRASRRASGSDVLLDLPDVGHRGERGWRELAERATAARRAWEEYERAPGVESFARLGGGDAAGVVEIALGELALALAGAGRGPSSLPPVAVAVASELPIGSGFGSSAALAVGTLAAVLTLLGEDAAPERVEPLALEVERRQHGSPSGVDHGTVLRGGVLWAQRRGGALALEPIAPRPGLLDRLQVFHSGVPAETTGAVVAAVRGELERDRGRVEGLLARMGELVGEVRRRLDGDDGGGGAAAEGPTLAPLIRAYQACLEELGVVPVPVRRAIADIVRRGGAAKISGAGALSGSAAGSVIVEPPADGVALRVPAAWTRHPVTLGAPGLVVETVA